MKTLSFDLPASDAQSISSAQLIYDVKESGSAQLAVNGTSVGELPGTATVPAQAGDPAQWVQRSIEVNPSLFKSGTNTITLTMAGNIGFDRLQFEFAYGGAAVVPPAPLPSLKSRGDLNGDGKIGPLDISRLLSKWASILAADLADADISAGPGNISSGKIDLYDVNIIMRIWAP